VIDGILTADFDAAQNVCCIARFLDPDEIGLIEQILPTRCVVVRGDRNASRAGGDRTRNEVLIHAIVVAVPRVVAQRQPSAEIVLHEGIERADVGFGEGLRRIAEEG